MNYLDFSDKDNPFYNLYLDKDNKEDVHESKIAYESYKKYLDKRLINQLSENIKGDVATSITTPIKRFIYCCSNYPSEDKNINDETIYKLQNYENITEVKRNVDFVMNRFKNYIDTNTYKNISKELIKTIKESLLLFLSVFGSSGNMIPIPKGTNARVWGQNDDIYNKLKEFESISRNNSKKKSLSKVYKKSKLLDSGIGKYKQKFFYDKINNFSELRRPLKSDLPKNISTNMYEIHINNFETFFKANAELIISRTLRIWEVDEKLEEVVKQFKETSK